MTSLEEKIEVVLLNHIFEETYMEDISENQRTYFYIDGYPDGGSCCIVSNYDKENCQLISTLYEAPDFSYEIVRFSIDCSTNIKKEGFFPGHAPILSGYLKCFLETSKLKDLKIDSSLFNSTLKSYIEEEYDKIIFFLEKSLEREIKQRQIDNPKEEVYNQEGIECCAVLNECLERMYFESESLLKVRREIYINGKTVQAVYLFFNQILFYLVGDIGFGSMEFLQTVQDQLNEHSEKKLAEEKLAYLLFLLTCLNEMVTQSVNESDGIHRQMEYTNNKKIEEWVIFIFKNYLQMELPPNSMNVEEVLKTFYRKKESEKNNGKVLQKISRLFRRES